MSARGAARRDATVADDILDCTATSEELGKTAGKVCVRRTTECLSHNNDDETSFLFKRNACRHALRHASVPNSGGDTSAFLCVFTRYKFSKNFPRNETGAQVLGEVSAVRERSFRHSRRRRRSEKNMCFECVIRRPALGAYSTWSFARYVSVCVCVVMSTRYNATRVLPRRC